MMVVLVRAVALLPLLATPVLANRHQSHGGKSTDDGGRLGQVTASLKEAHDPRPAPSNDDDHRDDDARTTQVDTSTCCSSSDSDGSTWSLPELHSVDVEASVAAQKVVDSGHSLSASAALVFNRRVRIGLSVSHYVE